MRVTLKISSVDKQDFTFSLNLWEFTTSKDKTWGWLKNNLLKKLPFLSEESLNGIIGEEKEIIPNDRLYSKEHARYLDLPPVKQMLVCRRHDVEEQATLDFSSKAIQSVLDKKQLEAEYLKNKRKEKKEELDHVFNGESELLRIMEFKDKKAFDATIFRTILESSLKARCAYIFIRETSEMYEVGKKGIIRKSTLSTESVKACLQQGRLKTENSIKEYNELGRKLQNSLCKKYLSKEEGIRKGIGMLSVRFPELELVGERDAMAGKNIAYVDFSREEGLTLLFPQKEAEKIAALFDIYPSVKTESISHKNVHGEYVFSIKIPDPVEAEHCLRNVYQLSDSAITDLYEVADLDKKLSLLAKTMLTKPESILGAKLSLSGKAGQIIKEMDLLSEDQEIAVTKSKLQYIFKVLQTLNINRAAQLDFGQAISKSMQEIFLKTCKKHSGLDKEITENLLNATKLLVSSSATDFTQLEKQYADILVYIEKALSRRVLLLDRLKDGIQASEYSGGALDEAFDNFKAGKINTDQFVDSCYKILGLEHPRSGFLGLYSGKDASPLEKIIEKLPQSGKELKNISVGM